MSSNWIGLFSVAWTTWVILSHAFPESIRFDWTPYCRSGSSPPHCPRDRDRLRRGFRLRGQSGGEEPRSKIFKKAFVSCLPLTRACVCGVLVSSALRRFLSLDWGSPHR
jgi:hypothetical protein